MGILKGNGTNVAVAIAGTDYVTPSELPNVPTGSNQQVQYNNNGVLAGAAGLTYNVSMMSVSEGMGVASGAQSHAEGNGTAANGDYSHAEGINTTAAGFASHAEGAAAWAQPSAPYGHADGLASVAYAPSQRAGANGTLLFNGDCQRTNTTRGIYTTDNAVHAVEGGTLIALAPRPRTFLAELSILSVTEASATPLVAAWRLDVVCQVIGPVLSIIIIRDPYSGGTYTPATNIAPNLTDETDNARSVYINPNLNSMVSVLNMAGGNQQNVKWNVTFYFTELGFTVTGGGSTS